MTDRAKAVSGPIGKALERLEASMKAKSKEKAEPQDISELLTSPQLDLFIATGRAASPKDELATMEHPVYAIEDGDQRILSYEHNGQTLEVTPSVKGRATIHDKDIVLCCVSKLVDAINHGQAVSRTVSITAHDLLKFTNRSTSGRLHAPCPAAMK